MTLAAGLGLAIASGLGAVPILGPPVDCPMNYSPVRCSNGVVYGNSCVAAAAGATGCVPEPVVLQEG